MIRTRGSLRAIVLGLVAGLVAFWIGELGWLSGLDARCYDLALRTRPPRRGARQVVVVQIDDAALRKVGRWPWPWRQHAIFLNTLRTHYHPAAVAFDILFSEPDTRADSEQFARAMHTSGNVYLADYLSEATPVRQEAAAGALTRLPAAYEGGRPWQGKHYTAARPPVPELAEAARGLGPVNVVPELDGSIRKVPLVIDYQGKPYPTLITVLANARFNPQGRPLQVRLGRSLVLGETKIPIDEAGETLVSYSPYEDAFAQVRYQDVLTRAAPVEALRGKVVIVGFGAVGMSDVHPTPVASGMLGVDINAQALSGLLARSFLRTGSGWARLLPPLLVGLITALAVLLLPPARAVVATLLLVAGGLGGAALLLWHQGVWVGAAPALLAGLLAYTLTTVERHRASERETLRMQVAIDTLGSASRLLGSVRQRAELLSEIHAQIRDALGADAVNVYLRVGDHLNLVAGDAAAAPATVPFGEGTLGWVAQYNIVHMERKPVPIAAVDAASYGPPGSAAYAPLQWRGEVIGVVQVVRRPDSPPLVDSQLPMLAALASEAAVALENLHLYEQLEGKVELANRELVQAYAVLKQERDRVSAIVENMADGVLLTDAEQRLIYLNPAAETMLGVSADVLGQPVGEVMPHAALLAQLAEEAEEVSPQVPRIKLEAPRRTVLSPHTVRLHDPAGNRVGALTVLNDITLLEELSELKSEFVSLVSHELRTPLTSIMGFSQLLQAGTANISAKDQQEFLGIIEQESNRLLVMINDLLDMSRMEAGRPLSINAAPVDLAALAREVARFQQVTTTRHTFAFSFPDQPLVAEVDRDRVQQMLTNLVSNAIKYSPGGGEITLRGEQDGDGVVLRVSDHGLGMTPEQVGMLFQRYQRVDRDAIKGIRGTGLGLFLVRGLAEAHGGKVWVESEPEVGSTFSIWLPAAARRE